MITGDYERRMRGLEALLRPTDLVEYDILRAQMAAGVASDVGGSMSTGYVILRAYATPLGRVVGEACEEMTAGHPLRYLQSALHIQGSAGRWPVLVISAFEELYASSQVLPDSDPSARTGAADRRRARKLRCAQVRENGTDQV